MTRSFGTPLPDETTAEEEALGHETRRLNAMISADCETLDALIADTALYIHSSGEVDSKHDYLNRLASKQIRYTSITGDSHQTIRLGSATAVIYRMCANVVTPGGRREITAQVTAVWRRDHGRMRLDLFQSTPARPQR